MKFGFGVIASAVISAGLLATACASPSPSAPPGTETAAEVVPAMEAAMTAASSVHIAGTFSSGGGSQKIGLDASIHGSDFSGTFAEGSTSGTIVVADGNAYVLLTQAYLKSAGLPSADCSTVCGKYLQVPASQVTSFMAYVSMPHLMSTMVKSLPSAAGDTTDLFKPATFHGQPVLQGKWGPDTVDVARTGTPYPLLFSGTAYNGAQGGMTFSEWNAVPPITPPPASQIISPSSL